MVASLGWTLLPSCHPRLLQEGIVVTFVTIKDFGSLLQVNKHWNFTLDNQWYGPPFTRIVIKQKK